MWRPPPVDRHGHWLRDRVTHPEMFQSKGRTGTKIGTETGGVANKGQPHLRIHQVCRHPTQHYCHGQEALGDRNLVWWKC